jgi:hypothetical protein
VKGIFGPPRASRLTPEIDWAADAERSLGESRKMRGKGESMSKSVNVSKKEMIEVH